MKLGCTVFLVISCGLTWFNNMFADFHVISLPISVFTFGMHAVLLAVYPSDVTSLGLLGLETLAKALNDEGVAENLAQTVKTQPRIGVILVFILCAFNQYIQIKREAFGKTTGVFFKSRG